MYNLHNPKSEKPHSSKVIALRVALVKIGYLSIPDLTYVFKIEACYKAYEVLGANGVIDTVMDNIRKLDIKDN